jgi:CHAT domain-containing protein
MPHDRLIHLATHRIASDEKPLEESYVVLAPSKTDYSKSTAEEVINKLKLKAELVVLSATSKETQCKQIEPEAFYLRSRVLDKQTQLHQHESHSGLDSAP